MTAPSQPQAGDEVLDAMAEVMERQARVNRAESALTAARQRLGESAARLSRVAGKRGIDLPPLGVALLEHHDGLAPAGRAETDRSATPGEPTATLRDRIVAVLDSSPEQVFTSARVARALGSKNRDSIRNTLLLLASKGRIDKLGPGQYRARTTEALPALERSAT